MNAKEIYNNKINEYIYNSVYKVNEDIINIKRKLIERKLLHITKLK